MKKLLLSLIFGDELKEIEMEIDREEDHYKYNHSSLHCPYYDYDKNICALQTTRCYALSNVLDCQTFNKDFVNKSTRIQSLRKYHD